MDIKLLYDISYGMYVVGANDNGRMVGCIANTVVQITNTPLTLAVSLNKDNYTSKIIQRTGKFSISILSEETNPFVITSFGFRSSKEVDKFNDFSYHIDNNLPILDEKCISTLFCEVIKETDLGTHIVVFANILDGIPLNKLKPMTYSYYHTALKGTAPKNAPTYQANEPHVTELKEGNSNIVEEKPEANSDISYRCSICGYIYHGDISKESDGFLCPICKKPREVFIRI